VVDVRGLQCSFSYVLPYHWRFEKERRHLRTAVDIGNLEYESSCVRPLREYLQFSRALLSTKLTECGNAYFDCSTGAWCRFILFSVIFSLLCRSSSVFDLSKTFLSILVFSHLINDLSFIFFSNRLD
jgi:hypothetical protein